MTDTNMLLKQTAGDTSGSDLLRVWSQQYGGDVALSLYETMTWLEQNGSWSALAAQYVTPTTGQTVTVDGLNTWVLITPLAALATLTIALPNIDNAKHGDEVLISTTQTLVSLNITIANATAIFGAPTTLSAGASLRLKYNAGAFSWFTVPGNSGAGSEAGTWVNDVPALRSDTALTYTLGTPSTVAAGDYVKTSAEGFAFKVAAAGAVDQHLTTAGGVKLYAVAGGDGYVYAAQFGVIADARASATANGNALNLALSFAAANGYGLDLGQGVIFCSVPLVQTGRLDVRGHGVNYWQKQYASDFAPQAETAIVMTGTGAKNRTLFGVSSNRAYGARRLNPTDRANYNDAEYRLQTYVTNNIAATGRTLAAFSVAWDATGKVNWGSTYEGFRIMPDAGGDDGMLDVRSSDRTATKPFSSGNWDVGMMLSAVREVSATHLQVVGQWRKQALLIAPHGKDFATGGAAYNSMFRECIFTRVAIRSVDVAQVVATTATTFDVPWADDHPFGADGDLRVILTTGGRSGTTHTYTSMTKVTGGPYDILRFNGVSPAPNAALYKNAMVYYVGGGSSHMHFDRCEIQGFGHGSLLPSEKIDLGGTSPFLFPQAQVEISGNELTEIDFGASAVSGYETVSFHMHDCRNIHLPRYWEMNTGARIIASPQRALNTHATGGIAACETLEVVFEPEGSTITDGSLDMRPYISEMDTPPLFNGGGDTGLFTPVYLRSSRFGNPNGLDIGAFMAAPKGGRAGIGRYASRPDFFAPTADQFDAALFYEDASDRTRVRKDFVSNTAGQASLGANGFEFLSARAHRFTSKTFTINDDAVATFTPELTGGYMTVMSYQTPDLPLQALSGMVGFDVGSSLFTGKATLGFGSGNLDVTTGPLTGTTGTDGNLTVSSNTNTLLFENRFGGTITVRIAILG